MVDNEATDLSPDDFSYIQTLMREHTGIALADSKRVMVAGRLRRRARTLGYDVPGYCRHLRDNFDDELGELVNAITTNVTAFFREPHHFEMLGQTVLPRLHATLPPGEVIRLWSCACSSGEEPYSIAMTCASAVERGASRRWELSATDIDTEVLRQAERGVYTDDRVANIDLPTKRRWFLRGRGDMGGMVRVHAELKRAITFAQLNLMDAWRQPRPQHVVFCRNVVIYFDKSAQRTLFDRIADNMAPGGYLFIGHSESLNNVSDRFQLIGRTAYQRIK